MNVSNKILAWLDAGEAHNLANMPWQSTDPYKVWVSEIMLQQTQVSTARKFYARFMQRFPRLEDLASASLDELLQLWAGMGYYARARNMHRTAQILVTRYAGIFPDTIQKLCELPGIGRSTAGALLSITQNMPFPVLDTNVRRVLIRLKGIQTPPSSSADKELWHHAQEMMPSRRCGDYNKGMMRLGALVCRPQQPHCGTCPLASECVSLAKGLTKQLPIKKDKKRKQIHEVFFALIINRQAELMLQRRPESGIWGGLWSFPQFPSERSLKTAVTNICEGQVLQIKSLPERQHIFSHCIWRIQPRLAFIKPNAKPQLEVAERQSLWYSIYKEKKDLGMPAPVLNLIREATKDELCVKYFV